MSTVAKSVAYEQAIGTGATPRRAGRSLALRVASAWNCDAGASRSIEGYSARDGRLHGSLDAYVYVCDEHIRSGREHLTGLATYLCLTRPADGISCGRMVDFR